MTLRKLLRVGRYDFTSAPKICFTRLIKEYIEGSEAVLENWDLDDAQRRTVRVYKSAQNMLCSANQNRLKQELWGRRFGT